MLNKSKFSLKFSSAVIFMSGAFFFALLNLFFKFHLIADDFSYQISYFSVPGGANLTQTVGWPFGFRQPIYILQYFLIRLSPHSTNLYYFLFQLIHAFNAVLIFHIIQKYFAGAFKSEDESVQIAFCAALLFLFLPTNFEILYWRSCLFYTPGLTLVLIGILRPSVLSALLWVLGYIFYEAYVFTPLLLLVPIFLGLERPSENRLTLKKFLAIYALSGLTFAVWRFGGNILWEAEINRYPIDFGFMGLHVIKRIIQYMVFHFSIQSSLKDYLLLTWIFRVLLAASLWFNRAWIRDNWKLLLALFAAYAVLLIPVSLVVHDAPRGTLPATILFSIIVALLLGKSCRTLVLPILALFILGHVSGAKKSDFNSHLYEKRVEEIKSAVSKLPEGRESILEINNFTEGMKREWYLQIGFEPKLIEYEIKQADPEKKFSLVGACPEGKICEKIDFRS